MLATATLTAGYGNHNPQITNIKFSVTNSSTNLFESLHDRENEEERQQTKNYKYAPYCLE